MSTTTVPRKKVKELDEIISRLPGFKLLKVETGKAGHLCCHIRDDVGNRFRLWASFSGKMNGRRQNNFKADARKMSNKMKGLID